MEFGHPTLFAAAPKDSLLKTLGWMALVILLLALFTAGRKK